MANTITYLNSRRAAGDNIIVKRYKVVLTGSYVSGGAIGTPGETLDFTKVLNPGYAARPRIPGGPAAKLPANTDFHVAVVPGGYAAQVEQNATLPTTANYVLRIFAGGSGAATPAELASGTYASVGPALTASPVIIEVQVPLKYA